MLPRPRLVAAPVAALLIILAFVTSLATYVTPAHAADGSIRSGALFNNFVVYTGDMDQSGRFDLYSVPAGGNTPVRLSASLPDGEVGAYEQAGERVVFSWFTSGQYSLYSVPLAGGTLTRLHPEYTAPSAGNQLSFTVAGSRVVFAATQENRDEGILYSVPTTGGTVERLSVALNNPSPTTTWTVRNVYVSDDNSTVAYTMALFGSSRLLYTVPVAGGTSVQVNTVDEPLQGNPDSIALTPNGARVAYLTVVTLGNGGQGVRLWSVAANGSDGQALDAAAQISFKLTGDGVRAVYFRSDSPFAQTGELRSAPLGGGASTMISASVTAEFALEASGANVFFTPVGGGFQRAPSAGGAVQTVLAQGFANLATLKFGPGGYVVFSASNGSPASRLYSSRNGGQAQLLDDPATSAGFLGDHRLVGEQVVYAGSAASDQAPQLFSVAAAGGTVTPIVVPYEGSENFAVLLDSDANRVLYGVGIRVSGQPLRYSRLIVVTMGSPDPKPNKLYLPLLRG